MTPYQWFNIFSSLGYVLFTATTSTLTLLVPAIVFLRPISLSLYSRATSWIFACWWTSCLFITERLNGVKERLGDDGGEKHEQQLEQEDARGGPGREACCERGERKHG